MAYGLEVTGDQQQLILGDDYPVLTRKMGGRILVTNPIRGYGICRVMYGKGITSQHPPMIFVTPTSTSNGKGLGLFSHIGEPGNWQGFSVAAVRSIEGSSGNISAGFDTGWDYHVCVFGDPEVPVNQDGNFGLVHHSSTGIKTFDSRWDIVYFRGLLSNWTHQSFTRSYSYVGRTSISNNGSYWGNAHFAQRKAYDLVLAKATHPWGAVDGDQGFMLSSLGAVPIRADVGYGDHHTQDTVVMVGFPSSSRNYLMATAFYGGAQHPSANVTALNRLNILIGDFSKIRW